MGWDFIQGWTKRQLIADLTKNAVAHATTASGLWVVHATTGPVQAPAGEVPAGTNFITLYLLDCDKKAAGYKAISEDMGPYYFDCPLKLLNLTTTAINQSSEEWRAKVRAYHESKAVAWAPGAAVEVHGKPYTLVEKRARSWVIRDPSGRVFKTGVANLRAPSSAV